MIEEQATVIQCENEYVWVQTERQSSCGNCSVKNGCGTQVLSKVLGNKIAQVRCLNIKNSNNNDESFQLSPGDRVVIGLKESALLSGSFLIYFLPLVSMILFGGFGVFFAKIGWPEGTDLLSIIFSIIGLILGLRFSQYYTTSKVASSEKMNPSQSTSQHDMHYQFEPVILKKLPSNEYPVKIFVP